MTRTFPASPFPASFIERLGAIMPDVDAGVFLEALGAAKRPSFRLNRLREGMGCALDELQACGVVPEPVSWCPDAFTVPLDKRHLLTHSAAFHDGRISIQNLSSLVAPLLVSPHPGETVLDLAAAPGGKTLHLAALMQNQGRIAAVEPVRDRYYKLRQNMERAGAKIVRTYRTDGRTVGGKCSERFDRVLLDAPCSAEARFRSHDPATYGRWSPRKIREQSRKQKGLIMSAARALKPGGVLVYCTCALAPEENEVVIDFLLRRCGTAVRIAPISLPISNWLPGLTAWNNRALHDDLRHSVRILPNDTMDAMFVCRLEKIGSLSRYSPARR